ncbi:hypothetical protein L195_g049665, partial [Trifolium pratense]
RWPQVRVKMQQIMLLRFKTIQQRSNSLVLYELHEVADAKAEVNE